MTSNKTVEYVSASGTKFNIIFLPLGIIVSLDKSEDKDVGIFILPPYFPEECIEGFIEKYSQVNWEKIRLDFSSKEEDL